MKKSLTIHNEATYEEIADVVLMPGDPLRAKFIAKKFLKSPKCFNKIRNMLGYTGTYKDKQVSVMGSGMGMPSMGIYSYELYNFYDVKKIIRIGTAGSITENLSLRDLVVVMGACSNSNFINQFSLKGTFAPIASYNLLNKAVNCAKDKKINFMIGNVFTSDYFYGENEDTVNSWKKMGVLAFEMETAALYINAAAAQKEALCLLTISDSLLTGESISPSLREESFTEMMEIALCCVN
ncbi:MAG: purine-nucleoside phosphorylase [Oscillospiraceae bacterium]|nr:purine-nucleoside phosphorylase [Oscillospiraceae bacterium]